MVQQELAVEALDAAEARVSHWDPEWGLEVPLQLAQVVMECPAPMVAPSAHRPVNRYLTGTFPLPPLAFMALLTCLVTSPSFSHTENTLFDQG